MPIVMVYLVAFKVLMSAKTFLTVGSRCCVYVVDLTAPKGSGQWERGGKRPDE